MEIQARAQLWEKLKPDLCAHFELVKSGRLSSMLYSKASLTFPQPELITTI